MKPQFIVWLITAIFAISSHAEGIPEYRILPEGILKYASGSYIYYPSGEVPWDADICTYRFLEGDNQLSRLTSKEVEFTGTPSWINGADPYEGEFVVPKFVPFQGEHYLVTSLSQSFGYMPVEKVTLPDELVKIGINSFSGAKCLNELKIPASVSFLGFKSLIGLNSLTSLTFLNPVPPVISYEYDRTFGYVTDQENEYDGTWFFEGIHPECTLYVPQGSKWFYNNTDQFSRFDKVVELPISDVFNSTQSVIVTDESNNRVQLKVANLGNLNVIILGINSASPVETFDIPDKIGIKTLEYNIVGIGPNAVSTNTKIGTLRLPEGINFVSSNAFRGSSISEIEIPSSLIFIGEKSFADIDNLKRVKIHSPQGIDIFSKINTRLISEDAFDNHPVETLLQIDKSNPNNNYGQYKSPWESFQNIEDSSASVTNIQLSDINVRYINGELSIVNNFEVPIEVAIYSIDGTLHWKGKINDKITIKLKSGIYILSEDSRKQKIICK